ncbi:MAG: helix-turn-helix domain-containing protein [Bdellovibrionaceae bacterium]|jgi:excisionase family DNA binding protein|nr:helix-turn-helix domain-containing protein [Pseudobdellovibrionaceae bacterium]
MKDINTCGEPYLYDHKKLFENQITVEWLSTIEAAKHLCITPNALRILVHRDQVKAYKFGSRLRFRLKDLNALLFKKEA